MGALLTVISLLAFSNAPYIATIFYNDPTEQRNMALFMSIIFFWVLDFSVNVCQAPMRSLIPALQALKCSF